MLSTSSTNDHPANSQDANASKIELSELAAMTGYIPELPPGKSQPTQLQPLPAKPITSESSTDTESAIPLLDQEDLEEEPVTTTKTPFWTNPLAKGGFVALLMAIAVGSVGMFLWSVDGNWNQQLARSPKTPSTNNPLPTEDPQQTEIGKLKTVAALGSQAQTLAEDAKHPVTRVLPHTAQTGTMKPTSANSNQIATTPPVQSPVYLPPRSYSPPFSSAATVALSQRVSSPHAMEDSQQAWQKALAVGSFGQISNSRTSMVDGTLPDNQDPAKLVRNDQQTRYDADATALLSGSPAQVAQILPGSTALATLKTAIVWAQDLKNRQQSQRFNLQLNQPIHSADGAIALPSGTQIVAQVNTISQSGLVELSVESIIAPTAQGDRMVNVPSGAIVISGQDGKPLIAAKFDNHHKQLFGKDVEVALMGALGQVGTLLNRPSNESTVTSPYLSSTNVTNGQTNILGGLLQGGFRALQNQVSQRQQQETQSMLNRPDIWYVPAGREVQVFINSPFEVRL